MSEMYKVLTEAEERCRDETAHATFLIFVNYFCREKYVKDVSLNVEPSPVSLSTNESAFMELIDSKM